MNQRILSVAIILFSTLNLHAQQKTDTVIVSLAKTSKVVFTIEDRSDLDLLKHYDFQALFTDILKKIQANDTIPTDTAQAQPAPEQEDWTYNREDDEDENDEEWNDKVERRRSRFGRTWQSFNFDLGTNNYLSDGKFPDNENAPYAVRPWGSWYVAASSIQRTRVGKNFFLEWGLGVSWYNFKFENDAMLMDKTDDGVVFTPDLRDDIDHIKSKLTVSYINASLVPIIDFGDHSRKPRMWDGYNSAFRIGVGPYVGYRIGSHAKVVYKEEGDRERDKNRDSFYLNNFRYGARLQLGFRSTDLFFNYDLNELFVDGKGPKLNAFSFGVIF
jgi:hypothetical protein